MDPKQIWKNRAYHEWVRTWEPDPEKYPYYPQVPQDLAENVSYRIRLLDAAREDKGLRAELIRMSKKDVLFWINTFCWLIEPRRQPDIIPFVTWPHQDPCIAAIDEALLHSLTDTTGEATDVAIEKSRGEGASWIALMIVFHKFLFGAGEIKQPAFGLVSRTAEAVDDPNDPDSLMYKLDFQLKRIPFWMRPEVTRIKQSHVLRNNETQSTIIGYSAVGDVASGGRKTCFVKDELAKFPKPQDYEAMSSTAYVTDFRILVSTFKGNSGAYYDIMRGPDSSAIKIVLDWKDNPIRNVGMFVMKDGVAVALDPINPIPKEYIEKLPTINKKLRNRGFQVEGNIRSRWYDAQCLRPAADPTNIAEELDRDPERSGSPFFNTAVIDRLLMDTFHPMHTGELDFNTTTYEPDMFVDDPTGGMELWFDPLPTGDPPPDRYCMGIDVAAGGGGSMSTNSVISIANGRRNKVAEFASTSTYPQDLARLAFAIGHWFAAPGGHPALMIFESNGSTGVQFQREIMNLNYSNLFFQQQETRIDQISTQKPGFHNQGALRGSLYGDYRTSLNDGLFFNPSKAALEECKFYVNTATGGIEHSSTQGKADGTHNKHNHGDRTTADALCNRGLKHMMGMSNRRKESKKPEYRVGPTINDNGPPGSFLHHRYKRRKGASKDGW